MKLEYELRPVYCNAVIGVQEKGCLYKLVEARVQLMSLNEARKHKKNLVVGEK